MKIRRYKKVQRNLSFYLNNFGFRQPYQVLVDGTFCFAALNNKINIQDNIPRYFQSDLKFLTTQCVIIESENLGPKVAGSLIILKKFPLHKCGHERKPIPAADCLLSMLGKTNSSHYVVATQDTDLQNHCRYLPGVPLIYLHLKAPVLEQPSETSLSMASANINHRYQPSKEEELRLNELKKKFGLVEERVQTKKKRKKGPNPLSCKKKKKNSTGTITKKSDHEIGPTLRKKLRVSQHIKEELLKNK